MSDIRVKYLGPQDRLSEVGITGKQQIWHRGDSGFVPDTDAALLVASGYFALAEVVRANLSVDASGNVQGVQGAGGRVYQGVRQGVSASLRMWPNNGTATTGAGTGIGKIIDTQHPALGDFYGVRLVYANYDITAPMVINKAKVAAAPRHLTPTGNSLTWSSQVTFGGSLTGSVPIATAGVGASPQNVIPGVLVSDFIGVAPVARLDGGTNKLLRVRTHINDNSFPLVASFVSAQAWDGAAAINGLQYASYSFADTAANLETNTASVTMNGSNFEPVEVIFYYATAVRSLAAFGDSITQGANSTTSYLGWPDRMVMDNYKSGGPIIGAANYGVGGQRLEDSLATARAYCAQNKPQYAAFFAWSPNNSPTQAVMDALWGNVLYTIDYLLKLGITPVVLTSTAVDGYAQGLKDLVTAQNARVKALPASVIVVDSAAVLATGGNITPAYSAGDGTHLNDVGYALMGGMVYSAIK